MWPIPYSQLATMKLLRQETKFFALQEIVSSIKNKIMNLSEIVAELLKVFAVNFHGILYILE